MSVFVLRRLLTWMATLGGASMIIFLVLDGWSDHGVRLPTGADLSPDAMGAFTRTLAPIQPLLTRYVQWLGSLLPGPLAARLAVTVPLAALAMAITLVLALAAGIHGATHINKRGDGAVMALAQVIGALPGFWLAILLSAAQLPWVPSAGFAGWDDGIWPGLKSLLLPAISLALVQAAILARVMRSAVRVVLQEDLVRSARARGLSRRAVLWKHVLRHAMIPVTGAMGLQFANLLAGTIVVENVFSLPGLGRLAVQSVADRDLVGVRDCLMLLAAMAAVVGFVVDALHALVDPRIRMHGL